MNVVEKEKELSNYIEQWALARYHDWFMFKKDAYSRPEFGIYQLKGGKDLLMFVETIVGIIEDNLSTSEGESIIPAKFSSITQLLQFLRKLGAYIEGFYDLIESNLNNTVAEYYIAEIGKMYDDTKHMVERCNQIYLNDDSIPIPYLQIKNSLQNNDLNTFIDLMKGLIMEIPYSVRKEKINEGYFHTVFHVISSVIGLDPLSEIETANGRLDMSFETPEIFYILEFKYNSKNEDESNKALKQIKKMKYGQKYHTKGKTIIGVGISYSAKIRNINGFLSEVLYIKEFEI